MAGLAALFALTAALYASVGFGGGSTYNALLALSGADYRVLPIVALACNIVVVAGGSIHFTRAGSVPWRKLWPILLLSAPCAWLGGRIPIEREVFLLILGLSLLVAGLLMLRQREPDEITARTPRTRELLSWPLGMSVGFLSGLVGIGGGIFLAPVLHLMRWETPRMIAGSASLFILINSVAGIGGQLAKSGTSVAGQAALEYWPLVLAVLIGGQLGSFLGARLLPQRVIRTATALLILYVAARLLHKILL